MSTWIRCSAQVLLERSDQLLRLMIIEGAVKQIYPDYAERFLLIDVRFIEHPHVNDDLTRFPARLALEPNPKPAV